MKRVLAATVFLSILIVTASAQDAASSTGLTIGSTRIGGYASGAATVSMLDHDRVGFGSLKIAATLDDSWAVGLAFSGLYYDKQLTALVADGTYHLNAAYAGIYVEKFFPLSDRLTASVSITSGTGEAKYQYDKQYRKDKRWADEVIDQTTFAVFEPGAELTYRVSQSWHVGVTGSYRSTSPVQLFGTSESVFREFSYGAVVKWQIF